MAPPPSRSHARTILSLLVLAATAATAQTCYWPNGKIAANYTSCNSASKISNCCDQNSVCLSNGFCMNQVTFGNRLLRGACTDQEWGPGCQQMCKDTFTASQSSLLLMGDFDPGTYCCGNAKNGTCVFANNGSTEPFPGPRSGAVIWNRMTGSSDWNLINKTSSPSTVETVTDSPTGAGTSLPLQSESNGPDASCPKEKTIAVGAGVGAGLGVVLALVGGMLFWQMRKRKEAEKKLEEMKALPPAQYYVGEPGGEFHGAGRNGYMPVEGKSQTSELHGSDVGRPLTSELRA